MANLRLINSDNDDGGSHVSFVDGVMRIEHDDGSVSFEDGAEEKHEGDPNDFYRNLADEMDSSELASIATELLTGIELDQQSRKDWLETRATGIRLLAMKIEEPRGDMGTSSAPLEGMSSFRHPLLLEATIRFQATARGELLPATGPVKVRNDMPMRPDAPPMPQMPGQPGQPPNPMMGNNGGPPLAETQEMDELAAALEKDFNHYLTAVATEYIPDTDRMLFYVGFGGDGFKKVYNCPLRDRPVSESVDAEDIIVSNAATDIRNCGRVTHRIKMRPSVLRRMQILGAYRDVALRMPSVNEQITPVEQEKAEIGGYRPQPMQPKDADHEIFECYCELDLPDFAPKQFKNKGLALPYVVTLEKQSRQILAVRRNWDEEDDQALTKQFFVQFPFIRGLGFYGLGLIHILGNVTIALTAILRIMIDNGMFSNFPGFIFAKSAGRQNTNQIRIPPGGGFPVDVPPGMRIQDAFMALPYKDTGTAFANLAIHLEELGQRLGQTADVNVGEGKQEVPVGTTMALIEQATKVIDSVHKRMHAAQAEEFGLLKERFKENPESFWRGNKKPARQWQRKQFLKALDEYELVPVADPNNPTSLHRIAKATIIDALLTKYGQDMDRRAALKRILRTADIDADGLMTQQTMPPPPDPRMEAVKQKGAAEQMSNQIEQAKLQLEQAKAQAQFQDADQERAFKEKMQQFEMQIEQMRVQAEMIIHAHDIHRDNTTAANDMRMKQFETQHEIHTGFQKHQAEIQQDQQKHQAEMQMEREKNAMQLQLEGQKTQMQMQTEQHKQALMSQQMDQEHKQQMEQGAEKHKADMDNQQAMTDAKAKAVGPEMQAKTKMAGEAHKQKMSTNDENQKMKAEKHKADLANNKTMTQAKAKALTRPKPAGDKK